MFIKFDVFCFLMLISYILRFHHSTLTMFTCYYSWVKLVRLTIVQSVFIYSVYLSTWLGGGRLVKKRALSVIAGCSMLLIIQQSVDKSDRAANAKRNEIGSHECEKSLRRLVHRRRGSDTVWVQDIPPRAYSRPDNPPPEQFPSQVPNLGYSRRMLKQKF